MYSLSNYFQFIYTRSNTILMSIMLFWTTRFDLYCSQKSMGGIWPHHTRTSPWSCPSSPRPLQGPTGYVPLASDLWWPRQTNLFKLLHLRTPQCWYLVAIVSKWVVCNLRECFLVVAVIVFGLNNHSFEDKNFKFCG